MPSIRSIVNAKLIIDNKIQAIRSWEMFPPGAPDETSRRTHTGLAIALDRARTYPTRAHVSSAFHPLILSPLSFPIHTFFYHVLPHAPFLFF